MHPFQTVFGRCWCQKMFRSEWQWVNPLVAPLIPPFRTISWHQQSTKTIKSCSGGLIDWGKLPRPEIWKFTLKKMPLFQPEFSQEEIGCFERASNDGVQNFTRIYLVNYHDIIYLVNYSGGTEIRGLAGCRWVCPNRLLSRRAEKNVEEILSRMAEKVFLAGQKKVDESAK